MTTVTAPPTRRPAGLTRRILTSPRTRLGLILMVVVAAIALIGPLVAPYTPSQIIGAPFAAPSGDAVLGTDYLGHDVLSRFLWGGRSLLLMSVSAALLGVAIGTLIGLATAYFGGWADVLSMRAMDVLLAFPTVVFVLLFVAMFGSSEYLLVLVVAIAHVPGVARVVRGSALSVVRKEYVAWARSVGVPSWRILTGEILPNITSPLMVEIGLRLMWSVGALASLSFLGYGIQPPASDWGLMINENRNGLNVQVFSVLAPILAIAVFTIGGNLFAEGVARIIGRTEGRSK